jgi:predicted enzyme related to lactoylglutathione lyase
MASSPTTATGIDATYYLVSDLARATAFYKDNLGLVPTMEMPDFLTEFTFPTGETFGLYLTKEFMPSGGVMFRVADAKATMAALKAKGVKFDDEELTDTPVCYMGFAQDSEGNHFIVHQSKEAQ